ncbi:FxSxx-COOH system tetratricopeptide repeat protein [Kutzneria sp. NPDC051319]|uniref:FxSxx-COOH system tetratricopeptide repeat protein n=1 Tax=Kutzneria sp. NPDC051319 TaxID=3155047 RepID=UPI003437D4E4
MAEPGRLTTRRLRPDEIADAIYLAAHRPDAATPGRPEPGPSPSVGPPAESTGPTDGVEPGGVPGAPGALSSSRLGFVLENTGLAADGLDIDAEPRWHNGFGLTGHRAIARALRPFKRTEISATLTELDEEKTADQAAVQRQWMPCMRRAQDRSMEAVLVVDVGESMVLWRRTATELRVLLERQAAFSTVRTFQLDTDRTDGLRLRTDTAAGGRRSPAELLDPTGRRLVLVLTDGIGAAWRDGLVQPWLARWGRCGPVAVLQVLPQSLWHWSRLEPISLRLRAPSRRVANSRLRWDSARDGKLVPIPVLELDELALGRWARLVAEPGAGAVRLPTMLLSTSHRGPVGSADDPIDETEPDALQRVLRFRAVASTTAFQLARLFAAAPLNLPVMTLVQRFMLPDARGAHLAEVFLSGLLTRIDDEVTDLGTVAYDFRPGVRQELLAAGNRRETVLVLRLIADRLGPRVAAVRGLRDALRAPDTAPHPDLRSPLARRFATVEQAVMTALGGDYSRRGIALRAALVAYGELPRTSAPVTRELPTPDPLGGTAADGSSTARPLPRGFPPIWGNVPMRNANFIGRAEQLRRLAAELEPGVATAVLPEAMHGMGGVGKTQIVVEFLYRYRPDYDLVWWIPSEDPSLIQSSFVELADRMGLSISDPSPQVAVPAVLRELRSPSSNSRWLLVFDNADDPDDLRPFLPQGDGHVIVTSRNPRWSEVANAIAVDVFERSESVALLQRRCPALPDDEADQLAAVLGDLPLALEQAGAWCAETGMPVPEYLELFQRQCAILRPSDDGPLDYPVIAAAAWNVSLERIGRDLPQALQLVRLCSCFAPEPIRRGILGDLRDLTAPADQAGLPRRRREIDLAIREIKRYSLVRVDRRNDTIQLHRIVQAVVRDQMTPAEQDQMRHVAHLLLLRNDPRLPGIPKHWPLYSGLQPHVRATRAVDCGDSDVRRLVVNQAVFLNAWGNYQGAYEVAEEARRIWHERLGERDLDTLAAARRVGVALRSLGRFARARELDEQTFALLRETVGEEHEETLILAGLLSSDLRAVGDFAGAKGLNEDTYIRTRRVFGDDDPTTLFAAHNLAMSLRLTGDYAAARELDERTWRGRREVFGEEDRFTLMSLDALALDERLAGDHLAACRRQERTVELSRRLLADDHPQKLTAIANLAVARRKAGDHAGALALSTEAWRGLRRRFGVDQLDTMAAAMNVSIDRRHADELADARELGQRGLQRYRDNLGEQHPFTSAAATNLAVTVRLMGDPGEAAGLDRQALTRLRGSLGDNHPYALVAAANLASDLAAAGDHRAALDLDTDTLTRSTRTLGDRHPSTLAVALNHVLDLAALGRDGDATTEHTVLLERFRGVLGPTHPAALNAERRHRADCDIEPIALL